MVSSGHEFRQALEQLVSAPRCLRPSLGKPECWGRFHGWGRFSDRTKIIWRNPHSQIQRAGHAGTSSGVPRNTCPREQDRNIFFMTCLWKSYDITSTEVTNPPRFRARGHRASQWEASMPHCRRNMWDGRSWGFIILKHQFNPLSHYLQRKNSVTENVLNLA